MNLGTLIDGLGCFPFDHGTYLPQSDCLLYLQAARQTLALKLFRGEPAISQLDWNFSPIHSSSAGIATNVGSDLRRILLRFHPGHG